MPELFYYGSGAKSPEYDSFDFTGYNEQKQTIIDERSKEKAYQYITQRLDEKIQV
jgi:hypothetical protein